MERLPLTTVFVDQSHTRDVPRVAVMPEGQKRKLTWALQVDGPSYLVDGRSLPTAQRPVTVQVWLQAVGAVNEVM